MAATEEEANLTDDEPVQVHRPGSTSVSNGIPAMTEAEAGLWQELIRKRNGHHFSQSRQRFLSSRLWERMRTLRISSYYDYYKFIVFNPKGQEEWLALQELLLNTETSFFRHEPSFQALSEYVLPRLREEKRKQGMEMVTMWSAGCSIGQEAYSLAMAFFEAAAALPQSLGLGGWGGCSLKISASDICRHALDKARQGLYKPHELRHLSEYYQNRYLRPVTSGSQTLYQVIEKIRAVVQYGYLQLHDPQSYWIQGQDIIFCQNVLIYFSQENRVEVVRRLCQSLNPGGYLFLGPAEVVRLELPGVRLIRLKDVLLYQRIG